MTREEIKAEKMQEIKREMYEQERHERKMAEDSEYAMECIFDANADEIDKAKELLNKVSKELFVVGIDIKNWEILKDYV